MVISNQQSGTESNGCLPVLNLLSLFCAVLGPLQQTIPVTIKMGIPTPVNANKIIPHQIIPHLHAQEPISQVSLDSVKVAININ